MRQFMARRRRAAAVVIAFLLAGAALAARAADREPMPGITVTGMGEVRVPPDLARVTVGVTVARPTAQQAMQDTSAAMARVLASLKGGGVAEQDVQTLRVDLRPEFAERPRKDAPPGIVGYRASNQVRVTVRDLASLGALLDRLVADGGNTLAGVEFDVAEPERIVDEARRRAVAEARRKAELYAAAAGTPLTRVLEIVEQESSAPRPRMAMLRAEAAAADVPVAPGELEFRAVVSVRYAIE